MSTDPVNRLSASRQPSKKKRPGSSAPPATAVSRHTDEKSRPQHCKFCPYTHPLRKEDCPAFGKVCTKCGKKNHFAAKCSSSRRAANCVDEDETPEPEDWINAGELCVCIDPRELNRALLREHYTLPPLNDNLHELSHSTVFSKADLFSGCWHVQLDTDSSLLTTFQTCFGRSRWLRLPFGTSVSSEIFQRKLLEALQGLPGVVCIADDVLIHGRTENEHDYNLNKFLERCAEKGIKPNQDKQELRMEKLSFMGHIISKDGLKTDPEKVRAITEYQPPINVEQLRRFLVMANYLARYVPHLTTVSSGDIAEQYTLLQKLVVNLSQRVEELNQRQKTMNNRLLLMDASLKLALTDQASTPPMPAEELPFPLSTMEEVDDLEGKLEESSYSKKVAASLATIGGENSITITRRIMERVFSHQLALQFNWLGWGEKRAFSRTKLYSTVMSAARANKHVEVKEEEVESAATDWLRFAKD